jgi:hypothetical protein
VNPSNELGLEVVLEVLENDAETVQLLYEHGVLHEGATTFAAHDVEVARLARTLLRDLEVNWEGTEIILRLRDELLATRRQVADLLELMRSGGPSLI